MTKRLRRLYLGRGDNGWYGLGTRKKDFMREVGEFAHSYIDSFCDRKFESVTGVKLKPGEVRKVRIHVELLD